MRANKLKGKGNVCPASQADMRGTRITRSQCITGLRSLPTLPITWARDRLKYFAKMRECVKGRATVIRSKGKQGRTETKHGGEGGGGGDGGFALHPLTLAPAVGMRQACVKALSSPSRQQVSISSEAGRRNDEQRDEERTRAAAGERSGGHLLRRDAVAQHP